MCGFNRGILIYVLFHGILTIISSKINEKMFFQKSFLTQQLYLKYRNLTRRKHFCVLET